MKILNAILKPFNDFINWFTLTSILADLREWKYTDPSCFLHKIIGHATIYKEVKFRKPIPPVIKDNKYYTERRNVEELIFFVHDGKIFVTFNDNMYFSSELKDLRRKASDEELEAALNAGDFTTANRMKEHSWAIEIGREFAFKEGTAISRDRLISYFIIRSLKKQIKKKVKEEYIKHIDKANANEEKKIEAWRGNTEDISCS